MSRIEEDHGDVLALRITVPRNQHRRSSAFSSELSGRFYEPGSFQKLEMQRQSVKREGERKRKQAERHRQHLEKQQNDIERKHCSCCSARNAWRRDASGVSRVRSQYCAARLANAARAHVRNDASYRTRSLQSELQWQQERLQQQREQRKVDAPAPCKQSEADLTPSRRRHRRISTIFDTAIVRNDVCCRIVNEGLTSFVMPILCRRSSVQQMPQTRAPSAWMENCTACSTHQKLPWRIFARNRAQMLKCSRSAAQVVNEDDIARKRANWTR